MTRRPGPSLPTSIHPIEPVSSQPISVLTHWRIFQLRGPTSLRRLRGLHDLWEGTPHAEPWGPLE
jgi:hypothetical protein